MPEINRITAIDSEILDRILEIENERDIAIGHVETLQKEIERLKERDTLSRQMLSEFGKHGFMFGPNTTDEQFMDIIESVVRLCDKGRHMEIFEKAIKENDLAKHAWDRFMLCLRIAE